MLRSYCSVTDVSHIYKKQLQDNKFICIYEILFTNRAQNMMDFENVNC